MSESAAGARRGIARRLRGALVLVAGNVLVVGFLLAAMEGLLILLLNHPPPVNGIRRVLSGYYTDVDRSIIQFLPECAQYDAELGYTLRPGSCRFRNREFDTVVKANTLGLRDTEAALASPEVVVLGDSFAMGWGVEREEAFPHQLGQGCGMRTLNAGISSYGTAREARLLERLDRSAIKWLIVQYGENDLEENRAFRQRGDTVVPMTENAYRSVQQQVLARAHYRPGQHLLRFLPHLGSRLADRLRRESPVGPEAPLAASAESWTEAQLFLNALRSAPPLQPTSGVIVLELNGNGHNDGTFALELRSAIKEESIGEPWRSMTVLDVSSQLSEDQFMALDEHLNADGHSLVANLIARVMGCVR